MSSPRAPELILEQLRRDGVSRDDLLAEMTIPLEAWIEDQIDAATRENKRTAVLLATLDPAMAGATAFEPADTDATIAGILALHQAVCARKVWWCPHYARAERTGIFDEPYSAGVAEGIVTCERSRCAMRALGHLRRYQADQRCDVCDRTVPSNRFHTCLYTLGPVRVKFNACASCNAFYLQTSR
jgi:hypothetical protein